MQQAAFIAKTDIELDDTVVYLNEKWIVQEIRCEHYLRSKGVIFKFLLKDKMGYFSPWLQREDLKYPAT